MCHIWVMFCLWYHSHLQFARLSPAAHFEYLHFDLAINNFSQSRPSFITNQLILKCLTQWCNTIEILIIIKSISISIKLSIHSLVRKTHYSALCITWTLHRTRLSSYMLARLGPWSTPPCASPGHLTGLGSAPIG